jgi:glycosyltransferase involved in cell wall biosynthesis
VGGKAAKAQALSNIAKRQPHLEILTTTPTVAEFFSDLGFHARAVPYPVTRLALEEPQSPDTSDASGFQHVLVAGAARLDKGFARIADFVEHLQHMGLQWPVWVQCSATHRDKHSPEIQHHIDRLSQSGYAPLNLLRETLSPDRYRALFKGGISLQPYSAADFQDRVSGVTLDALCAGCPVIVTANTWLARTVLSFGAGVATDDLSPAGLYVAVATLLADYAGFAQRAAAAGRILQDAHSANALINAIFER